MRNTNYHNKNKKIKKYKISHTFLNHKNTLLFLPRLLSGFVVIVFSITGLYFLLNSYTKSNSVHTAQDFVKNYKLNDKIDNELNKKQVLGVKTTNENFDLSKVYQTRNLYHFTYFLSGDCHSANGKCSIGFINKLDNKQIIFSYDILGDIFNLSLKENQQITIAKKQDFSEGINIVWVINSEEYKLIRFHNKERSVFQVFHITQKDSVYNDYI